MSEWKAGEKRGNEKKNISKCSNVIPLLNYLKLLFFFYFLFNYFRWLDETENFFINNFHVDLIIVFFVFSFSISSLFALLRRRVVSSHFSFIFHRVTMTHFNIYNTTFTIFLFHFFFQFALCSVCFMLFMSLGNFYLFFFIQFFLSSSARVLSYLILIFHFLRPGSVDVENFLI